MVWFDFCIKDSGRYREVCCDALGSFISFNRVLSHLIQFYYTLLFRVSLTYFLFELLANERWPNNADSAILPAVARMTLFQSSSSCSSVWREYIVSSDFIQSTQISKFCWFIKTFYCGPSPFSDIAVFFFRYLRNLCYSLYRLQFLITVNRPTQSVMYIPFQVNRCHKSILRILQYKFLKSCSEDFILKNPTKIWFSAQDHAVLLLLFDIVGLFISARQKSAWSKWFVSELYQHRRGILEGPALKYFYMIHRGGRCVRQIFWFAQNHICTNC